MDIYKKNSNDNSKHGYARKKQSKMNNKTN